MPPEPAPRPSRGAAFWARVDRSAGPTGCWPWTGPVDVAGAGRFSYNGRTRRARRVAFEAEHGPLTARLQVTHTAPAPDPAAAALCCNPGHLSVMTPAGNPLRPGGIAAVNAAKPACPAGHAFTAANTARITRASGKVARRCRTCHRDAARTRARAVAARRTRGG